MKKRNQEKVVKIFATVIILIMIFQVFLPLFSSATLNSDSTTANVTATASTEETQLGTTVATSTPTQPVTVTTTPVTAPTTTTTSAAQK